MSRPTDDLLPLSPGEPVFGIPPGEETPEVEVSAAAFRSLAEGVDWGHANLRLPDLHAKGADGEGVTVAILDTGVDVQHPDLKEPCAGLPHRDFTGSRYGFYDRQGHGSHCAGIAAARADGQGIRGAAPKAKVLAGKVLSDGGSGLSTWIAAGIRYAADQGVDVISMSLGGPSADQQTRDAIRHAIAKGCWVVAAAGNEGPNTISFPGAYPESVCVAATDQNDRRAGFSSTNREVDVAAPGVEIWSTLPGNRYGRMSGTSMATPYVAGALAAVRSGLKKAGKPVPGQVELIAAVKRTAKDLAPPGPDTGTGAGLLDPVKLLEDLMGATGPNPPPVPPSPPVPPGPPPQPEPGRVVVAVPIPAGSKSVEFVFRTV